MSTAEIQGQLWGTEARDWAEIQEPVHAPLWDVILSATAVGPGSVVADLGCGGGGASKLAVNRGASVYGLDAAEPLVDIARERVPEGDFRTGDLEDLPFDGDSFDAVLAANSVQFAGDPVKALAEMARVCRSDGRVAVAVWGLPEQCDARHLFAAVVDALPERPGGGGPFALSMPGVLDDLLFKAGLTPTSEQIVPVEMNFPDLETAWRGARSAGPLQGAIRAVGDETIRGVVEDVLIRFKQPSGQIRMLNEFKVVTAETG
jgi:SAM-dependent methyltransferase